MGRTGKPKADHVRDGTFQACRHGRGNLPVEIPPRPADLSPHEQAQWNHLAKQLEAAGLISSIDGPALRLICECDEIRIACRDYIREKGLVGVGRKGGDCKNPVMSAYFSAWDRTAQMLRQFGMTPIARRGINLEAEKNSNDDIAEILKIKRA